MDNEKLIEIKQELNKTLDSYNLNWKDKVRILALMTGDIHKQTGTPIVIEANSKKRI